ncbi:MAG: hypothetical protein NWT04_02880 [Verrucomicrobiales bacterium]|nr:hypothetical protein [Verrucomicrobiales bacterium]MDP4792283.1 hypothetical protein [Verrucomicrobiales bacterium]
MIGAAQQTHDSGNLTRAIPNRKLRDHEPIRHTLTVPPEFEPLDHFRISGEEALVIIDIGLRHETGVEIEVRHSEDLRLVVHRVALTQSPTREHEMPFAIFGKKMKARNGVKEPVKMACWSDPGYPRLTHLFPGPHLDGRTRPPAKRLQW